MYKKIRYYYWLIFSFLKKNFKLLFLNFVIGFFLVILFASFFPLVNSFIFSKVEKIGVVGTYDLTNLPGEIQEAISNPLLSLSDKGEITPVLISSYEILDGNKIYRLRLKSDIRWSDGEKFTAYDINLNFKGIETKVIDETTIEFRLKQPLSIFPIYLTKPLIKDEKIGVEGLYTFGEYKLQEGHLVNVQLYPQKKTFPKRSYHFYDTENKLINAYKKGSVNFIRTPKVKIVEQFSPWKNTTITKEVNYRQMMTLFFDTKKDVLSSKETREAIVWSVPYFEEYGERAKGPIPPFSWAYFKDLKSYTPNPLKTKDFFKKDSSDEKRTELNFYTFYDYLEVAEQIKKNLEGAGLTINLKVLSYLPQDFDLLLTVWNPPPDPDQYYFWHSTQRTGNITNYKNVRVDKLLEDGRKTLNVDDRRKIYIEFQKNIVQDLPAHFMYYPYVYTIRKK